MIFVTLEDFFPETSLFVRARGIPEIDSRRISSHPVDIRFSSLRHLITDLRDWKLVFNRLAFCCVTLDFFFNRSNLECALVKFILNFGGDSDMEYA